MVPYIVAVYNYWQVYNFDNVRKSVIYEIFKIVVNVFSELSSNQKLYEFNKILVSM